MIDEHVVQTVSLFRGIVLALILAEKNNPSKMKARVMFARINGHIDGAMCEDLILLHQLESA